ncbi:MAG: replication initiator protein [Microviridae sp.]|nr:MAG: replication initiator protein [Microviridae sp.]
MHERNCFITLTYNDESLPVGGTLVKKDAQDFLKRLRFWLGSIKISYFLCGEYGDDADRTFRDQYGGQVGRPHYHALIFGYDFREYRPWEQNRAPDSHNYFSQFLEDRWGKGITTVGDLTPATAAYCARYATKKITGPPSAAHYRRTDPNSGECFQILPEFITCSTRPAIGDSWLARYGTDVYPSDEVIHNGKQRKPPRFYDKRLDRRNSRLLRAIKGRRIRRANSRKNRLNSAPERMRVREEVKQGALDNLKRNL